jgi:hypothetical protein
LRVREGSRLKTLEMVWMKQGILDPPPTNSTLTCGTPIYLSIFLTYSKKLAIY